MCTVCSFRVWKGQRVIVRMTTKGRPWFKEFHKKCYDYIVNGQVEVYPVVSGQVEATK